MRTNPTSREARRRGKTALSGYLLAFPPTMISQRMNVIPGRAVSPGREEALPL
jgi:hypothetical protein